VAEIEGDGGRAVAVQADVARAADVERLFSEAKTTFGRLDIVVNSAGVYEFLPIEQVTEAHFHRQFDLNVLGLILAAKEAVKHFGAEGGSIVNISSVASTAAPPNASVYSATKAAVDAVTRSLAKELGPRKIRVNAINPGMVETEGFKTAGLEESDFRKQIEAQTPLGRIGQPQDVAPAAVFSGVVRFGVDHGRNLHITGECADVSDTAAQTIALGRGIVGAAACFSWITASELHEEELQGDGGQESRIDLRNVRELERGSVIAGVPVSECAKGKT